MSDEEQQNWYFDFGESSKDTEDTDSDDPFGPDTRVATREDVVNGRADTPFGMMVDNTGDFASISGIEGFTQNIAQWIVREADSYSRKGMESSEMNQLESEIEETIRDDSRVTDVRDVTVQSSERPYENEVQITMALDTNSGQYTSEFFLGDASKVDLSE